MSALPANTGPRIAVRALIVQRGKLLLVNAYPGEESDLWCAPGGGAERHQSLPGNLQREVYEETGLTISVGDIAGVNEFHDPTGDFHQVELFFHAVIEAGELSDAWQDPDAIVSRRRFVSADEMRSLRFKPDCLLELAFGSGPARYDPLETLVR